MKSGKVVHSTFFLARVSLSPDACLRLASVAPTKVAKTAALRNQTRRRMYAAMRISMVSVKAPAHAIILAKTAVLTATPAALEADMKALFVKAGLLR